ncbi:MAG: hypothetical protein AB7Q37_12430 [Pyrinomonadaceae bacterium]
MKRFLLSTVCGLAFFASAAAQDASPTPILAADATDMPTFAADNSSIPAAKPSASTATSRSRNWYVRPDSKTRFKSYINSMVGPGALARSVMTAGIGTWQNAPEEWGDDWEGFGRRFASGMGRGAIKNTVIYGLDESLKYDSKFYRSQKRDAGSRLKNALLSPVTARDKNGKRVLGIPRIVGTYSANIIAQEAWYPKRFDTWDALRGGSISLTISAGYNVFREFIWKK